MTPAIEAAKAAAIDFTVHEYTHDPKSEAWGLEAADKLNLTPGQVFKTLVAQLDGKELIVGMVPVDSKLSLKALAKAAGGKKATMAEPTQVQRSTGYVLGGVSALGQKKPLRTFIDATAQNWDTLYISAGRRGLEIQLAPADLCRMTRGAFAPLRQE